MNDLRHLLSSLVKAALMGDDHASVRWREEARRDHARIMADPAAVQSLKIDGMWTLAVADAEAPEFREAEGQVGFGFPALCPFTLPEITDPDFDIDAGVERIRKSASTG
ncbi:hypothetical protein G3T14_17005 [Methylobacterium sp. BTF04]|uniref:hypothetical protein n=1 Tax=Methylobacterium sp. BTF04 TaxID=2708300 RepID=UPI0013D3C05F|nr:hypothetical protein [Methylobacterium sp. BTF04]NEU13814.1 hypothetical protein [Methylobacterium sp. BTF04]